MHIVTSCVLLLGLALSSCGESESLASNLVATPSQTQLPTRANIPSATAAITATPILNNKTIILTPDDVFTLPGLKALSTPDSSDFCEHLPSPQIIATPDRFSILAGRFMLCSWENWPWVTNMAIDLDTGSLVSKDDERADIVMQNGSGDWWPNYGVFERNNAYISDAYILEEYANHSGANHLSYEYCEDMLRGKTGLSVINVEEGVIACIRTTEDKIALLRVEKIYPINILSVGFSFAILRDE